MTTTMAAYVESSDDEVVAGVLAVVATAIQRRPKQRQRRATLPYVLRRREYGAFHCLVQEMAEEDPSNLRKFLRMSGETFDSLLHLIGSQLEKKCTTFKDCIPAEERLAVTLHFLAAGGPKCNMLYLFRIPVSTLQYIIPETCQCIYTALKDTYLKFPNLEIDWTSIQQWFYHKWNFPQCLGALDGKHIRIKCPPKGGSLYFNYLHFHSIVLLAVVDADYKFLFVDVGSPGRYGDATIWNASALKKKLDENQLSVPAPVLLPGSQVPIPSVFVADSAFALTSSLMKPYPEKNLSQQERLFNYRLSRARRVVENAFGILASRFGVYQGAMNVHPNTVVKIVLASVVLHNFLRSMGDNQYFGPGAADLERGTEHEIVNGDWRVNVSAHLPGLQPVVGGARNSQNIMDGKVVRDALKNYFVGPGAVPWQHRVL